MIPAASSPSSSSPPADKGGSPTKAPLLESSYTKTSQELIQFVTTLRSLGAQVFLDLPRIVVIGNQSAGKSSLVEAISGISVPRDAGTCTRCPMECRLAHAEEDWSCQISIRWEYDDYGDRLSEVREVPFGPRLTSKTDVEPTLRRAQAAILNGCDTDVFVEAASDPPRSPKRERNAEPKSNGASKASSTGSLRAKASKKTLEFSRNTICVDLSGPDLVDLSFVDLPGIVQNAEDAVVRLVEDLVTSYVEGNCLILVALPMSDDIENQKAARIATHADPYGVRTIGVLTKPDTLPPGSTKRRQLWLDVLEGREHPLQHGYYCTRQPDDDQRLAGITLAEARSAEVDFFQTTSPWKESTCAHRLGTRNLVKSISQLLTRIISDSLPRLLAEVSTQLANTNIQLATLPPVITTEPSAFVLDLVTKFRSDVAGLVEGSPRHKALVQGNKEAYVVFKQAILDSAPTFVPYESAEKAPKSLQKKNRYAQIADEDMAAKDGRKCMYLSDVRKHIEAAGTRELPNNIPYPAKRSLVQNFQKTWEAHTMECFNRVQANFKRVLGELIRERFERFHHLRGIVGPTVMEQIALCALETEGRVKTILEYESALPFTQNTYYLGAKRVKQLSVYKQARAHSKRLAAEKGHLVSLEDQDEEDKMWRIGEDELSGKKAEFSFSAPRPPKMLSAKEQESLKNALAELIKLGYPVSEEDLGKLNKTDEFEEEMEVMAEVRAYFEVSYKRIIDYVPLAIDRHLLYALSSVLQGVLIEKLGLGSAQADARCTAYITEDPHVVAQRSELLGKRAKLEAVQKALFNFGL